MSIKNGYYKDASAGTGKTYWIVNNKLKEIYDKNKKQHNSDPADVFAKILIVTYTEKATGELRNRIREEYNDVDVDKIHIFTIHSFCQHILQDYAAYVGQPSELSLVDTNNDATEFIQKWIRDELTGELIFKKVFDQLKEKSNNDDFISNTKKLAKDLSKAIQDYQPSMVIEPPTDKTWYANLLSSSIGTKNDGSEYGLVEYLFDKWQENKASRKVQTYNDMIINVHNALLNSDNLLLNKLKEDYKTAIIDEFQDTNQLQWEIFSSIFDDENHSIYVVGDPKQSIYAFQGADVTVYTNAINSLEKVDENLINYRSSEAMIDACNKIFKESFFDIETDHFEFNSSNWVENNRGGLNPTLTGFEKVEAIWFPDQDVDEYEFARFAVDRIVFCTAMKDYNSDETNLRIPKSHKEKDENGKEIVNWKNENVSYDDFAILARTSSEMKPIEQELKKRGVPYIRYKDKNLFNSLECRSWISLLSAIDADDYTDSNRRILNEALYTKFFNDGTLGFKDIDDKAFDYPSNKYRKLLLRWHLFAERKRWTELIESIFENSNLENRLINEDKLQSLTIFRQIGNYILEYLFENSCSLKDVCNHLSSLSNYSTEDNGELVERGTDKDCVRIMTIHAAKGLEFPIVIPVAGFKKKNNQIPQVYSYHDRDNRKHIIGFSKTKDQSAHDQYWEEQIREWRRLFYVAYTRAKEIMILPRYIEWVEAKEKDEYWFLKEAIIEGYMKNSDCKHTDFPVPKTYYESSDNNSTSKNTDIDDLINQRKTELNQFYRNSKQLAVKKHSYSSLSHPHNKRVSQTDKKEEEANQKKTESLKKYDSENVNDFSFTVDEAGTNNQTNINYPKGKDLGSAVHEVFEKAVFKEYDSETNSLEALLKPENSANDSLAELISDCFKKYAVKLDDEGTIMDETKMIVWNTLNARIPEIKGNTSNNSCFKLSEIEEEKRLAEVDFFFDVEEGTELKQYCNGAVDLIFERNGFYSILDWKTDTQSNDGKALDYSDYQCLKNRVDEAYSIQRVLYSYSLIKWLKQFKQFVNLEYSDIFDKYFGGIYYVFVRGCIKDKRNGIYAQTWNSWNDLEKAYKQIRNIKMR